MANERLERQIGEALARARMNRRRFLQIAGLSGAAIGLGPVLAACRNDGANGDGGGGDGGGGDGTPTGEPVRIGYVSPATGPLAPFGEADDFILGGIREAVGSGLTIAGATRPIEIITKDSQSDPNRAAQVASDLIVQDEIHLMVVASTPET